MGRGRARPQAEEDREVPEATVGMSQGGHRVGREHHRGTQDPVVVTPIRVLKFFTDQGHMKTSETLLLASDVGAYFLRHIDIDPKYRDLYIRLIHVTERSARKHNHTNTVHTYIV